MKKLNHVLIATVLPICLAQASCPAQAQPATNTTLQATEEQKDPVTIYKEAGINREQENKIRQMAQDFESSARVKQERMKNLTKQLRDYVLEVDPAPGKVLSAQEEINHLLSDIRIEHIKLMLNIRALLTTEQKTKLVQILKERSTPGSAR